MRSFDNLKKISMLKSDQSYKINNESIELLNLANNIKKNSNILELGAGSGFLSIALEKFNDIKVIDSYEINLSSYNLLIKNIKKNKCKKINSILGNFNELDSVNNYNKYDFIISNPPFYKKNSGRLPMNDINKAGKYEIYTDMKKILSLAANLLKNKGVFLFCYPSFREGEILKNIRGKPIFMKLKIVKKLTRKKICYYKLIKII